MDKKINALVDKRKEWGREDSLLIEVDGGVKVDSLKTLAALGVDLVVVGSGVFNARPVRENLRALKEQL